MDFMTIKQASEKWGICTRRVQTLCISQNSFICRIVEMLGLLLPVSHRLTVVKLTLSSFANASCEKNRRCLVRFIVSANVILVVSLYLNAHIYRIILASIRRLVNESNSSASRAFVTRKRFSACWGNSPIPIERCLRHRAAHPFRML